MKRVKLFFIVVALGLFSCQKCFNYTAPVINFNDDTVFRNFPDSIHTGSHADSTFTLSLRIVNGSYGANNLHMYYTDSYLHVPSLSDSSSYAAGDTAFAINNMQPFDESYVEKLRFTLLPYHKYYWRLYVTDEKGNRSNIITKTIFVKI